MEIPHAYAEGASMLRQAAILVGTILDDTQVMRLLRLRDLLLDANTRMNLTAITDPELVLARHLVDSLTCLLAVPPDGEARHVLDVGSGAGFPALVLAIACPHWQITALEATAKKVHFQESVITALGLTNMRAYHGRAEVQAHAIGWRGHFHIVTARALAALPTVLEWCQPFARRGGVVIALKKGDLREELEIGGRAARILSGAPPEALALPAALGTLIPDLADDRVVIRVRQQGQVAPRYPRSGNTASRAPLGSTASNA